MHRNRKGKTQCAQPEERLPEIERLGSLFKAMVENHESYQKIWQNIPLGKEAFDIMRQLPDVVPGEIEGLADKASLLANMLSVMEELTTPRFCLSVREYIHDCCPDDKENNAAMERLKDYIDPAVSNEEWSRRHGGRTLKFDPVERSEAWEEVIYEAEKECDEKLGNEPRGMGFCFGYWSALHNALQKRGVEWRNPRQMNPHVLFD